ncbi:MAG: signal peptidase II [Opitutales bacterium]|nr:signal peptidase II [Opitutales bacterium]|tara:strand:+ start:934 stop:1479 length:546 start_codon:yes stop_codon:yes gene_type:complete
MNYVRFWGLSLAVLVLDQLSKTWADCFRASSVEVFELEGFLRLSLTHVTNSGASFSMFSDYPEFLTCLAIVALLCIWLFRKALEMDRYPLQYIFGAIYGGVAGNLTDRLFRGGEVVDFIDFTFQFIPAANGFWEALRYFPVFNFADTAIFLGVVCYLGIGFKDTLRSRAKNASPDSNKTDP